MSDRRGKGTAPDGSPWLCLAEAGALLGMTRERLWAAIKEDKGLREAFYQPHSKRYLLPESACLAYVEAHSGLLPGEADAADLNPWAGRGPETPPSASPGPRASA